MCGSDGEGDWLWTAPVMYDCAPFNIVSALTLNKGGRPWTSLVLLKMFSETWPRLKITNLKSNMEAFPPCILQSLKENFSFFYFVFGAKGPGPINLFLFYELFYPVGQSCPPWPTWHPWGSFQIRAVFSLGIESNLLNSPHRLHGFQRPKYFQKFIYDWHPVLRLIILLVSRMT